MMRTLFAAASVPALLLLAAAPLSAPLSMEKYPFEAGKWIHLGMEMDDVRIEDVKFHKPHKLKGLLARHDKPNRATVVARNAGNRPVDMGVAVAVFREDGTLLAAGNSGATIGVLQPGERHEFDIAFHSVFRQIDEAAWFLISVEF
jgi:hypothetical protein